MGNICIENQKLDNQLEIEDMKILQHISTNQELLRQFSQTKQILDQPKYILQQNKQIKDIIPYNIQNFDQNKLDLECLEQILENKGQLYRNEQDKYYFQGQLENNQKNGFCQVFWDDGNFIAGKFKDDVLQSKGFYLNKNGDFYQGQFLNNRFHGEGILKNTNQKSQYYGEFKKDKRHGYGTERWKDGSKYIGYYINDKKHGDGTYKFSDGSKYKGQFRNDKMEGEGRIQWQNGEIYEGNFKDNKMHGYGVFKWTDGIIYKGYFENNNKQGEGELQWKNGISFKGNFINDKQEGKGVIIDQQGRVNVGMWKKGQLQDQFKATKVQKIVENKFRQTKNK